MSPDEVEVFIGRLQSLPLEGLRDEWRVRFGPPPKLRSPELLRHIIAWRVQAAAFGGIDVRTRRLLKETGLRSRPQVASGARIAREWKGVRYEVEAVDDGFLWNERRWDSLSQIAREITGARWNGPRFFGLRAETSK